MDLNIIVVKTLEGQAANYNDSFYPGHFINNEFIRKEKNGQVADKQSRFIFRKSDDMFAYCIEPFKVMKENQNVLFAFGLENDYYRDISIKKKETALGYGNTEALKAVKQVEITENMGVNEVLKQALKYMIVF